MTFYKECSSLKKIIRDLSFHLNADKCVYLMTPLRGFVIEMRCSSSSEFKRTVPEILT